MILAIDQGTTSTRAILFDTDGNVLALAQKELQQYFPAPGWVEHDPEEIWNATLEVGREALAASHETPTAIGITNQRETTVLWDKSTGLPLHRAIVWQDRRTTDQCRMLCEQGHAAEIQARTGLIVDPYFSATKLAWLLDNVEGARSRAERGELAFGTIDTFLLARFTGQAVHATDATNASRTMLWNIHGGSWDNKLLDLFRIPPAVLPTVQDSAGAFGRTTKDVFGQCIPITGIAGDQQAAAFGQVCFAPGTIKSTYGTGAFVLANTGPAPIPSQSRLLTTVAFQLDGQRTYALEGSIFCAGATVQWLRDSLGLIPSAAETEGLARSAKPDSRVFLIPAFTGLGAPYWDPEARAALLGMTRDTGPAEIARAALESVGYQTRDLLDAMRSDGSAPPHALRVDGGMAANDFAMQFLADILGITVDRPATLETTALGAAYLAGLGAGVFASQAELVRHWQLDRRFEPTMSADERDERYARWQGAVARVRTDLPV